MIKNNNRIPLYIQLADQIRAQINTGAYSFGEKLPSETEMVNKYQIGRLTIRQALSVLVNEGLLEKQHGRGTFVKSPPKSAPKYIFDLLLDTSDVYFIPYYLRGICSVFETEACNTVISDTKDDTDTICSLLEKICSRGSDGVIVQPSSKIEDNSKVNDIFLKLEQNNIPYIMIDGKYNEASPSYVIFDERKAGELAGKYFLKQGHTDVCMVLESDKKDALERKTGFAECFSKPPSIIKHDNSLEPSLLSLLKKNPSISALFCYNDLIAKNVYTILNSNGIKIPGAISVISVDNTVIAATLLPNITSIVHPKEELGKKAAEIMLDIKRSKINFPYQKVFQPSLFIRNSVCRHF